MTEDAQKKKDLVDIVTKQVKALAEKGIERITETQAMILIQHRIDELSDCIGQLSSEQQVLLREYRDLEIAKQEYKILYFYNHEDNEVTYKKVKRKHIGFDYE